MVCESTPTLLFCLTTVERGGGDAGGVSLIMPEEFTEHGVQRLFSFLQGPFGFFPDGGLVGFELKFEETLGSLKFVSPLTAVPAGGCGGSGPC